MVPPCRGFSEISNKKKKLHVYTTALQTVGIKGGGEYVGLPNRYIFNTTLKVKVPLPGYLINRINRRLQCWRTGGAHRSTKKAQPPPPYPIQNSCISLRAHCTLYMYMYVYNMRRVTHNMGEVCITILLYYIK